MLTHRVHVLRTGYTPRGITLYYTASSFSERSLGPHARRYLSLLSAGRARDSGTIDGRRSSTARVLL